MRMNNTTTSHEAAARHASECAECAARPPVSCKRCGCFDVSWRQTNAGRWYLLAGNGTRRISPPHRCEDHNHHLVLSEVHEAFYRNHEEKGHRVGR